MWGGLAIDSTDEMRGLGSRGSMVIAKPLTTVTVPSLYERALKWEISRQVVRSYKTKATGDGVRISLNQKCLNSPTLRVRTSDRLRWRRRTSCDVNANTGRRSWSVFAFVALWRRSRSRPASTMRLNHYSSFWALRCIGRGGECTISRRTLIDVA